jgi:polar amino acid transport system substrate-binding protein
VFGDMIAALRAGEIDLHVAFTVPTRNRWGVAVAKGNDELRAQLDAALAESIGDGSLARAWTQWMPNLAFPLGTDAGGGG